MEMEPLLLSMGSSLRHRGPDDGGLWFDQCIGVGLAHRRLAVVDLSPAGAQPMESHDGRYVLSFNGEIYNHHELRQSLVEAGVEGWHGHSDTEVLLAAMVRWGVDEALRRCNGMFAIALWDRLNEQLLLARDRTGEKPLYVGWVSGALVFGSELRALRCHPRWKQEVEPSALALMLRLGYVPAPWSIHKGVFKLPAASLLRLRVADAATPLSIEAFTARLETYWSLDETVGQALAQPWGGTEDGAMDAVQALLDDAVRIRMMADVSVGALLSGGVDSSLVVASMQRQSRSPVRTFTVGFDEVALDESGPARDIARLLGTEHEEIRVSASHALDMVTRLPDVYDEPFADAAQIPALLVCEAARKRVTVALTGDGGDELFHGYQRYLNAESSWGMLHGLGEGGRRATANFLEKVGRLVPRGKQSASLLRQAARIPAIDGDDYYARLLAFTGGGGGVASDVLSRGMRWAWPSTPSSVNGLARRMRYVDQRLSLPEGIHSKLDRASMAVALELRVPLLDPRLLALSWRMPQSWLARGGMGKLLLRKMLGRQLPSSLVSRPKHGFDVPISAWLRGPLREWAADLLGGEVLRHDPWVDAGLIRSLFDDHLSGRADYGYALWAQLMYLSWSARHG
ncbi:asparagine synthase (glutamine-hydrolyzing) [Dyella sp. LX-66]|nr:asparagine synthase (glutamine-hydrolyzing) [Dyella sp. LX-1]MBT2141163.1 asparagine synthase (glutamine-hydrolyzing) [Dyella sp. LX-66]